MAILINLNDARKKLNELEGSAEYNKGVTDAFNALFDLPTVNAEPIKHGGWIYNGRFCELNHYKCSVCGKDEFRMSDYCPNCGAKMDGGENG